MDKSDIVEFNGQEHKKAFFRLLSKLNISPQDSERVSLVYILTITEDCRKHFFDCYDRDDRCVNLDVLQHGWVTGTDARAIRLAFNLFNGAVPTALNKSEDEWDNLYDWKGNFEYDKSELLDSTPVCIFVDYEVGTYFIEGIKLRFTYLLES